MVGVLLGEKKKYSVLLIFFKLNFGGGLQLLVHFTLHLMMSFLVESVFGHLEISKAIKIFICIPLLK